MTDESTTDTGPETDTERTDDDVRPRIERALHEVRRECWKATTVHAVAEAAVVFLATNLVLGVVDPSWLPTRYPLPSSVNDPLADSLGGVGQLAVPGSATLAAALAVLAFATGVGVRVRRPLVEQFEAANPPAREALRTARDAVENDADSAMARRLYGDVLDRLGESSGLALVDGRRVAVTVLVAALLSVATVQVTVADPALLNPGAGADEDGPAEPETNYTGLLDGDQVLGDSEAVEAGEDELNASIGSTGGGQDVGDEQQFPSDSGPETGTSGDTVDSQQAGFAAPERVEDAELVREYNQRIRSGDDSAADDASDENSESDTSGVERGQQAGDEP